MRDVLSSFTSALIVENEKADTLRSGLVLCTSLLRINPCTIRIDTSPGFQALRSDEMLRSIGMTLDFGRIKNKDSNSVVDKAIQELEKEFLKHETTATLTPLQLQLAVDTLISRIRNRNLSAKEIILKRDQYSHDEIMVDDANLAMQQQEKRSQKHVPSSRSKAGPRATIRTTDVMVGDLVYVKHDKSKHKIRDRFIVTKTEGINATLQKINDKFMSKEYIVPLTRSYAAQPRNDHSEPQTSLSSSDEDDDDFGVYVDAGGNCDLEEAPPPLPDEAAAVQNPPPDTGLDPAPRRPQRERLQPAWMRSGEYDLS